MSRIVQNSLFILGCLFLSLVTAARSQTPAGTLITNTAELTYDGGTGVVHLVQSNETRTAVGEGALRVVKTANRMEVSLWDTLVYSFSIQNISQVPLTQIAVRDTLPRMLHVIHAEPSALAADNTVEWQILSLAPGETRIHTLSCEVLRTAWQETFENSAVYTAGSRIRGRSNRVLTTWLPWPEAALTKTADLEQVYFGDTLTYTLRAVNTGPMPLSQIQVSDSLPEGFQFLDVSPPAAVNENRLTWMLDALEPGAAGQLSFRGIVTADVHGDSLRNIATLASPGGAHSTAKHVIPFRGQGVGLSIIKEAADSVFWAGDTVVYDLILTNSGVRTGHEVVIRDTLPPLLKFIQATHQGQCSDQIVVWNLGNLAAGYHDTLRVSAAVRLPVADGTRVRNEVWARSAEGAADSSHWEIRIRSASEIIFEKSADPAVCFYGDTLTYALNVQNTGTTHLKQITVQDTLPAGLHFISSEMPVDTSGGILTWTIDELPYSESVQLLIRTLITEEMTGDEIRNSATLITGDTLKISAAAVTAFQRNGVGIEIIKEADDSLYHAGDTLTYDLILSNGGLRAGHAVVITDTLPGELAYLNSSHQGQHHNNIVTWRIGKMEPGYHDTLRVTVSIRVPVEDQTHVNNEVWARAGGASDSSHWEIVVSSEPLLNLEIQGPASAAPGDTICYLLIYSNEGTATAFEPVLRDTLHEFLHFVNAGGDAEYLEDVHAVHWALPPMAPGDRDSLILCARIDPGVKPDEDIVNSAWLSYRKAQRVALATCMTECIPPGKTLYAYKTVDRKNASEGDTLKYCIVFGALQRSVNDTIHIQDHLPEAVNWLSDITQLSKVSNVQVSYDPISHSIHMVRVGLEANQKDSVWIMTLVQQPLDYGVFEIENQALVFAGGDTARTEDDSRTHSVTRLIKPFLSIKKTVNRKIAESGDVLTYTLTCVNKSRFTPLTDVHIRDLLPKGFRYQPGTSRRDSIRIDDPDLSHSGKRVLMEYVLRDTLQPGQTLIIKYRTLISLAAHQGNQENLAQGTGSTPEGLIIHSAEAIASVLVRQGAFDERGFIFGKIVINRNRLHGNEPQLKNVEIIMEDGTRVRTDEYGKYSIPNVDHGQHVLRLNENTLPARARILNDAFGYLDDPKSRLVIVPPGGMAKANFTVEIAE